MTDQNKTRFCRECGAAIDPGNNFCPACGAIIDGTLSSTSPASSPIYTAPAVNTAPGSNRTLLTLGVLTTFWAVGAIILGTDFLVSVNQMIEQMKTMAEWQTLLDYGFTEEMMRTFLWICGGTFLASGILAAPAAYFLIAQRQHRLTMALCILSGIACAFMVIPLFFGIIFAVLTNNNKTSFRS